MSLIYQNDDIRLCQMESNTSHASFDLFLHYHRHEGFHYLTLNDDDTNSLALRAGLKSFDRIIQWNDQDVQNWTGTQLQQCFDSNEGRTLRLLVCDPATFRHYRESNRSIDANLDTVQQLEPVSEEPQCGLVTGYIARIEGDISIVQTDNGVQNIEDDGFEFVDGLTDVQGKDHLSVEKYSCDAVTLPFRRHYGSTVDERKSSLISTVR
jgi:hypothetical protein